MPTHRTQSNIDGETPGDSTELARLSDNTLNIFRLDPMDRRERHMKEKNFINKTRPLPHLAMFRHGHAPSCDAVPSLQKQQDGKL